ISVLKMRWYVAVELLTEEEGERHDEQQRLKCHCEELLGVTSHLLRRPPRQRQRLGEGLPDRDPPSGGGDPVRNRRLAGRGTVHPVGRDGRHRVTSVFSPSVAPLSSSPSPVSWPVRDRNTSSRLGFATLTELTETPAVRNAMSTSAASSAASSGAVIRPCSGVSTGSPRSRVCITAPAREASSASVSTSCRVETPTEVLSSSGVPWATIRPWSMTAIRSAS